MLGTPFDYSRENLSGKHFEHYHPAPLSASYFTCIIFDGLAPLDGPWACLPMDLCIGQSLGPRATLLGHILLVLLEFLAPAHGLSLALNFIVSRLGQA